MKKIISLTFFIFLIFVFFKPSHNILNAQVVSCYFEMTNIDNTNKIGRIDWMYEVSGGASTGDWRNMYVDFGDGSRTSVTKYDGTSYLYSGSIDHTYSSYTQYDGILSNGNDCVLYSTVRFSEPASLCSDPTADNNGGPAPCTYTMVDLNFVVGNSCSSNSGLSGATVSIDQDFGNGTTRSTDGSGFANFGAYKNRTVNYTISKSGFDPASGSLNTGNSGATTYVNIGNTGGCPIPNSNPNAPTISGSTSGYTGTSYNYTFNGTDPDGNQVKYGIDWNSDGTVDQWLPSSGLVNSGTSLSTTYSWSTTGTKTFKALTQDSVGANSGWTTYSVTISTSPTPVNGTCGTNATTYSSATSAWPSVASSAFCSAGTAPASSPTFPSAGSSITWTCAGSSGGTDRQCTASRTASGYSVTVSVTSGGTVRSADNTINCTPNCSSTYAQNSVVTLQAYPASSYWKFSGWTGDCNGNGLCLMTVNDSKSVTATFTLRPFNYSEF